MTYLVDTNVISELVKKKPFPHVLDRIEANHDRIAIATVVWHELAFGCLRMDNARKRRRLEEFLYTVILANLPILPYDRKAAQWHAEQRAALTSAGKTPSFVDGQIAAVAATNNLILVTRNTSDFAIYLGLRVENWHDPG